ncbi:hypothetical protein W97_06520 [Coniosporium apollinis CBS 100218]|uniref:Mitochondrial import inner membrane translocase subunit TIM50 n=1 Tax=Coniosporium apollinis (strain CBS 100218) TaxID=1168221 RepID=R7YZD0_CONA1|nr:uncharacterized protein W97_06520 [Coniosporium apollinis CBS 100218]EON67267.1 hypothetical protein W97_06520 [Coniosporium apollinis CBS 100218]
MLARAASRLLVPRALAFPATRAATAQSIRTFKLNKQQPPAKKPSPPKSSPNVRPSRGPEVPKDLTWKRNDPIKFAAAGAAAAGSGAASSSATPTTDAPASPEQTGFSTSDNVESTTEPQAPSEPVIIAMPPPTNQQPIEMPPPSDTPQNAQADTASSQEPVGAVPPVEPSLEDTPRPSQPLPDLRQGIPSTFEAEFLKPVAPEEPPSVSKAPGNDVNLTDDPREPASAGSGGRGTGELPKSAYETSSDRRRNRIANYSYAAMALAAVTGTLYLGREWEDEAEKNAYPDIPSGWSPSSIYQRATARLSGQMGYYTEPTFPKLLPAVDPAPPYTLVLSLEDLMVHSEWTREHGWRTAKRPGIDYFLRYLSQYYELVIFTSLPSASADPIIRKLDPFHIIMWPLFREATKYEKGEYIKDLSYLNRDLSKVILIDTKPSHAKLQPENSIILPPWKGEPANKDLVALIPLLEYIATMGIADVRTVIKSFEGKPIAQEFARREAKAREAFQKALAEEKAKRPKHSGTGWLLGALGMKPQAGAQAGGLVIGDQSAAEGFEQGKMLSDQIRERGQKQYEAMEKEIRENGEKWLKEMEMEEKKAQEEQLKSMKSGFTSWFGSGRSKAA